MTLRAVPHRPEAGSPTAPVEDRPAQPAAIGADSQRWQANPDQMQAHRDAIRLVSLALAATSCTQERAAKALGISVRQLQLKLEPEGTKRLSFSAVLRLADVVPGFGDVVGVAVCQRTPQPRPAVPRSPESHAMRLSAIVGDLSERTEEAVADGTITDAERRELVRLHQQAIERHQQAIRDMGGVS